MMNSKIFRSSFFVALAVLITSILLIMGILHEFFQSRIEQELKSEANYIAQAMKTEGLDFFDGLDAEKRITVIAFDGDVLYDSYAQGRTLENHRDRKEVKEAIEKGSGTDTRYSEVLSEKTIYYAVKLDDCVLRVSAQSRTALGILLSLTKPFSVVLFLSIILCFILSSRVSKSIIRPINNIDLENPEDNEIYDELSPLLHKLAQQKTTINNQIKDAQKKQEEFRLITENMREGFLVIDKNTNLLTYNSSALKLLDIENPSEGSVLTLCRTKGFRDVIEKSLGGERAKHTMESGEKCYRLISNPVFEHSEVIGAVIIIIDVTESEKREALRREFTANVSHELKTPLTSISGFAELMKNGGTPDEVVKDFSGTIYSEAQRLITLVNDILKISELDEETLHQTQEVDLYEISAGIVKRLKPIADKKGITIILSGKSQRVLGDDKIIDDMIYNLCDNAIKYNKENGTVEIIINNRSVTVKDTGIGIPKSEQKRVFERFYRVDKSHSKTIGGTGLGLAIVKHGAIYHNAHVELNSDEGEGTSVTIYFNG